MLKFIEAVAEAMVVYGILSRILLYSLPYFGTQLIGIFASKF